ncbi:hypothetical protein STEG23_009506 [Scotinomys teguina]
MERGRCRSYRCWILKNRCTLVSVSVHRFLAVSNAPPVSSENNCDQIGLIITMPNDKEITHTQPNPGSVELGEFLDILKRECGDDVVMVGVIATRKETSSVTMLILEFGLCMCLFGLTCLGFYLASSALVVELKDPILSACSLTQETPGPRTGKFIQRTKKDSKTGYLRLTIGPQNEELGVLEIVLVVLVRTFCIGAVGLKELTSSDFATATLEDVPRVSETPYGARFFGATHKKPWVRQPRPPLSLTLSHWTDVRARAHNEGVEVRKKKWITLCEAEWDPVALTNLIESILVTHRPTWDDCQQLLQTLLTVEEKQRVVLEARKQVPGDDGRPTQLPNLIDAAFPLTRPDWDFNAPEVLTHTGVPLSQRSAWVQGATGSRRYRWTTERKVQLASGQEHDCLQILAEAHGTRPDLTDQPLNNPDLVWYTDGSSFLENGERRAGAAVTTETEVIWASALPPGTSAQRAELIALTQALRLAEGKRLTVYTDSRYAFATAHIHGEIYRRRGLLTSAGKEIKNKEEILDLLRALFLPAKLSIVHCPGHQKGDSMVARGNRLADQTARAVATQSAQSIPLLTIQEGQPTEDPLPYSPEDHELAKKMGASWDPEKQAYALQDKLVMPTSHTRYMLRFLHALTHLSKNKMKALLADETSGAVLLNQDRVLQQVTSDCPACAQVNPGKAHLQRGACQRGHRPGIHWETDFTEVKPGLYGYRYLLVFVDTFSGWIEAFPTKKETANMVVKKMLEEIFPRLIQFIRDRISTVQTLVLTQQYQRLNQMEIDPSPGSNP